MIMEALISNQELYTELNLVDIVGSIKVCL